MPAYNGIIAPRLYVQTSSTGPPVGLVPQSVFDERAVDDESARARDLFYALWTPDLFMERVKANGDWTLFNPDAAPGLADVHGAAFKALYERYEQEGRGKTVKAQELWFAILDAQIETGTP